MRKILLLLLFFFCIVACNTKHHPSDSEFYDKLVQVVKDAKREAKEEEPEKVRQHLHKLENILRTLPREEEQDDSLIRYVQDAIYLDYFLNIMVREFPSSLRLLDSLSATSTPFLKAHAQHELLAARAEFNLRMGETGKAIALADSFSQLLPPKEALRLVRCNLSAASVYNTANELPKAIKALKQSADAYHKDRTLSTNIGPTLSWLGVLYHQVGKFEIASQTILEAIEFYEKHPEDRSTVIAYGEQANLYFELGMLDKALDMNYKAMQAAQRNYNYNLGDIYGFRATMLKDKEQWDSVYYYIRKYADIAKEKKSQIGIWSSQLEMINAHLHNKDSIGKANELLTQLCADSTRMPGFYKLNLSYCRGKVLTQSGQIQQAIKELENTIKLIEQSGMIGIEKEVRSLLMENYLKVGESSRLAAGFERYQYLTDSLNTEETKRMVAGANIRFETEKKEQENRLLTSEVELKNNRLRNYTFIGITLFCIALCIGGWFWMRHRSLQLRLRLEEQEKSLATLQLRKQEEHLKQQEERLQQIIASRQELNRNNEDLLRQLAEVQIAHEKTCDLDQVMESLQPRLITPDEEEIFRSAFGNLYPSALHSLRTTCPRITRSEELLCMLIVLKQTNEEISRTLGISRSSVLQSRYRLKQKLELLEGVEMDSEIKRIMVD